MRAWRGVRRALRGRARPWAAGKCYRMRIREQTFQKGAWASSSMVYHQWLSVELLWRHDVLLSRFEVRGRHRVRVLPRVLSLGDMMGS